MLPGLDQLACQGLAVPIDVMEHVVRVESSFNPFAIGVVGGRLVRQPETLPEALATVRMLEEQGYDFSLGLAQVNRRNLARYGLTSYEAAFDACPNLRAGASILAKCHQRTNGDWGQAFSCYYSGNTVTGFRHGYVQKVLASMRGANAAGQGAIRVIGRPSRKEATASRSPAHQTPVANSGPVASSASLAWPASPMDRSLPAPFVPAVSIPDHGAEAGDPAFVF